MKTYNLTDWVSGGWAHYLEVKKYENYKLRHRFYSPIRSSDLSKKRHLASELRDIRFTTRIQMTMHFLQQMEFSLPTLLAEFQ